MEKNFTLPAFVEPITALPDTPNLSAAELKRRFQAPSDELREVHNALAKTVQGITDATYPETVSESMLTADLAGKINGKADADTNNAAHESFSAQLAQKCECYFGTYTGDGAVSRVIELGFQPVGVIILCNDAFFALKTRSYTCSLHEEALFNTNATRENGFVVSVNEKDDNWTGYNTNKSGTKYEYLAFKA